MCRFKGSCWKFSRTARQEESSSQVSQPLSSNGRTQVSKILHVDSGFRSPWKAPRLPRAKKAFLAFLTFSFTDFDADRFDCQQTPRHFAAGVVSAVCPMI